MSTRSPLPRVLVSEFLSWFGNLDSVHIYGNVHACCAGHVSLDAMEIIAFGLPAEDRYWGILRPELIDERTIRLFLADCAERVVHLFEDTYPEDRRPRQAIEAARSYGGGLLGREELLSAGHIAAEAVRAARHDAESHFTYGPAKYGAWRAACIAQEAATDNIRSAHATALAAQSVATSWDVNRYRWGTRLDASALEDEWQMGRLREYLLWERAQEE